MTTSKKPANHEECRTVLDLQEEIRRMRGNGWKILSAVLVIVFGFGGCTSTMAMYYTSKTGDEMKYQRKLIDSNKDSIHKGETQYQKLEGTMSAYLAELKEQREEQKKLVEAVHRIEVIIVKRQIP